MIEIGPVPSLTPGKTGDISFFHPRCLVMSRGVRPRLEGEVPPRVGPRHNEKQASREMAKKTPIY